MAVGELLFEKISIDLTNGLQRLFASEHEEDRNTKLETHLQTYITTNEFLSKPPNEQTDIKTPEIIEFVMRNLAEQVLLSKDETTNGRKYIEQVIDLSLWCVGNKYAETTLPFILMEEIFEMLTVSECENIFPIFENKVEKIRKNCLDRKGILRLLKATISLLRRLCKSTNTIFNGRLLTYLAAIVPISDKSGLNTKGDVTNVVTFDEVDNDAMDTEEKETMIDHQFYKTFWGIQKYLKYPNSLCGNDDNFSEFMKESDTILSYLSQSAPSVLSSSSEETLINQISLPDVEMEIDSSSSTSEPTTVFMKYLTSTKLFKLQLNDNNFIRHILLQYIILCHSLLASPEKSDTPLNEAQKSSLTELELRVIELISKTQPYGKQFYDCCKSFMMREDNWVNWKNEGCNPFEKEPGIPSLPLPKPIAKKKKKFKVLLGNSELNRLWNPPGDGIETDPIAPSLERILRPVLDEMDPVFGCPEEEKTKNDKTYLWKVTRLIAKNKLNAFSKYLQKFDLEQFLPVIFPDHELFQATNPPPGTPSGDQTQDDTTNENNNNNNNNGNNDDNTSGDNNHTVSDGQIGINSENPKETKEEMETEV